MRGEARGLLAGEAHGPVTLDEATVSHLLVAARARGARVAELSAPAGKAELLDAIGTGLRFPGWWGRNWDALSELLHFPEPADAGPAATDGPVPAAGGPGGAATGSAVPDVIAWRDPAVLAEVDPQAWDVAGEILREAIADRRARGAAPLVVVLTGALPAEAETAAGPRSSRPDGVVPPPGAVGTVSTGSPDSPGERTGHHVTSGPTWRATGQVGDSQPATRSGDPHGPARPAANVAGGRLAGIPANVRRVGRVHHVAVVVREMDAALEFWRDVLGLAPGPVVAIPSDRVNIAFLPVGEVKIELVEPTDDTTGVGRFLASRGEGFHHVCFEVPDIHAALTRLAIDGVELIDALPRPGAEGPVAFLHPRSCHGVLVELIEREGGPAWAAFYPAGFHAPGTEAPGTEAPATDLPPTDPPGTGPGSTRSIRRPRRRTPAGEALNRGAQCRRGHDRTG